jgi:LuxR family transcriptional regulator, maltose regulon positive regulatory protein
VAGFLSDVINSANTVAALLMAQGRLRDAERTLEQAVQRATEQGDPSLHGMADFLIGLSELRRERNELDTANNHLQRVRELAFGTGAAHSRTRWYVAMARIREAQGDLDGALDFLSEAERWRVPDFFPNVRPIAALQARIWIAQGRLDDARGWAREQGLSADDDLSYLREFEHITLARLLVHQSAGDRANPSIQAAVGLLERLLHAAEASGRTGSIIEILVLQALALLTRGDTQAALVPLERALMLAEPEGYVRLFVDEGPAMATLLQAVAQRGVAPTYVRQLLATFGAATTEDSPPVRQDLIEPLSERELQVLRLLATDLDGPEIANELMVSLNTLRTHTRNIYSKLGVNSRRAAVSRAAELDLLSRTRTRHPRSSSPEA